MLERDVSSRFLEVSQTCPLGLRELQLTWLLPTLIGNYYSFQNAHRKEARLFFTQGCVPNENEESPASQSKPAVQESEFEADGEVENGTKSGPTAATAKKARGRPKGKPKAK